MTTDGRRTTMLGVAGDEREGGRVMRLRAPTWREHWADMKQQSEARYLWWPLRLHWGGPWGWFVWHGIESRTADRKGFYKAVVQVYHLGMLRIVLGRK